MYRTPVIIGENKAMKRLIFNNDRRRYLYIIPLVTRQLHNYITSHGCVSFYNLFVTTASIRSVGEQRNSLVIVQSTRLLGNRVLWGWDELPAYVRSDTKDVKENPLSLVISEK